MIDLLMHYRKAKVEQNNIIKQPNKKPLKNQHQILKQNIKN